MPLGAYTMSYPRLATLHSVPRGLFEAARFDPARGLFFADARNGGVYSLSPAGSVGVVVEHRRGIGGLVLHERGGFVVTGRNVAYKRPSTNGTPAPTLVLLDRDEGAHRFGFNDLTVDARGRVYVGSLGMNALEADLGDPGLPSGAVFLIDGGGGVREVAGDIRLANGMAFSADGRTLYLSDSVRRVVFRLTVDVDSGSLTERSVLITFGVAEGIPDGLAVAEDGSIWVAHAYGGKVVRYTASGQVMESLRLPVPMVTSLCFGGPARRTLFIVTGTERLATDASAFVYSVDVDVCGIEVLRARTPIVPSSDATEVT